MIGLLILPSLIYLGSYRPDGGPPLATLLDPAHGLWISARTAERIGPSEIPMPGLISDVVVTYDDRGVPHIRAANQEDLYLALGYVIAQDRLFQLEIQTRVASGTLSELLGASALEADREPRRLGLVRAAAYALERIDTASLAGRALHAFAYGVNAYIDRLEARDLPVEFKLLGATPSRWHPVNSLHLLNSISLTLSHSSEELTKLRARMRVGRAAADALFPASAPIQEPVQPVARSEPRYGWYRLPPPGPPDSTPGSDAPTLGGVAPPPIPPVGPGTEVPVTPSRTPGSGSNSWAVAPARATNARALLVGDQHLDLTLPSIWYEVHLTVPDTLDVYGVTIPGAPGVVVGFNRSVAWTMTNAGADATDYYVETVDDTASPRRYMLDGSWRDLELREERYHDAGGELLALDTVRYSHRGPLSLVDGLWISMRWTIELAGNEIGALISAQNATSVSEWMQRTERFAVPALSMMAADTAGNIAVRFTGALPIRPDNGRGDMLRDGSSGESDWLGFWKPEEYPASLNPAQGYLAAANQQPTDYYADSRYFGADWPAPWRALRINQLLRERRTFTVDDMRRFQTDPRSVRAELFVPFLVAAGEGAPGQAGSAFMRTDADNAARSAALLREWSLEYSVDNQRAILFEYVMAELNTLLWDELDAAGDGSAGPRPTDVITATLLRDEGSAWWDLLGTVERERRDDILVQSLSRGYTKLVNDHGEPGARGWRWDRIRPANINHLLRLPQFSAHGIPVRGGPATLNPFPASGDHGSSWRMVVEMAPQVRAWGIYPGGQSGNPFSQRYSDRIRRWSAGELDELRFPRSAADLGANSMATLTLRAR